MKLLIVGALAVLGLYGCDAPPSHETRINSAFQAENSPFVIEGNTFEWIDSAFSLDEMHPWFPPCPDIETVRRMWDEPGPKGCSMVWFRVHKDGTASLYSNGWVDGMDGGIDFADMLLDIRYWPYLWMDEPFELWQERREAQRMEYTPED